MRFETAGSKGTRTITSRKKVVRPALLISGTRCDIKHFAIHCDVNGQRRIGTVVSAQFFFAQ